MKLYHGSCLPAKYPDLTHSRTSLDFGPGFYVTSDYDQALRWAKRQARRHPGNVPVVSVYDFDTDDSEKLNILEFEKPDENWLRFITDNRNGIHSSENDIVIGPVANDRTIQVITDFLLGTYTVSEAAARLLTFKLKDQWNFRTERALKMLKFQGERYG